MTIDINLCIQSLADQLHAAIKEHERRADLHIDGDARFNAIAFIAVRLGIHANDRTLGKLTNLIKAIHEEAQGREREHHDTEPEF